MSFALTSNSPNGVPKTWKVVLVLIFGLYAYLSVLHFQELQLLMNWWGTTSKYGHSLLIFPTIAYLLVADREEWLRLTPKPEPLLLLLIAVQAIALSAFYVTNVEVLSETILISMYPAILWLFLGRAVIKTIYMPLLLLMTVVPIWELLERTLTDVTATVAHFGLNVLNIPVYRDEQYLIIPEGMFEIASGCGGFRYFIVGLSLGLIHAHLNFSKLRQKILIVAIALTISVCINWLRVMIVIWAGHKTNMQHHFVQAHVMLGWYVFAVAFFIYFVVTTRYCTRTSPVGHFVNRASDHRPQSRQLLVLSIFVLIIISAPPIAMNALDFLKTDTALHVKQRFPEIAISGWEKLPSDDGAWSPIFRGAADDVMTTYRLGSFQADVYIAYYTTQSRGTELINIDNTVLNDNWLSHEEGITQFSIDGIGNISAQQFRAETSGGQQTVWAWYYVAGTSTGDRRFAKLLELKKFIGGSPISAVIAVRTDSGLDRRETMRLTGILLDKLYPRITQALDKIGDPKL